MPDDDVTLGEIRRSLERLERRVETGQHATDDRITQLAGQMVPHSLWAAEHKALEDTVSELRVDMKAGFDRVERTSQERKAVLERADADNARAIKDLRDGEASRSRSRTSTVANWIAAAGVIISVGLLVATLLSTGGH